MFQRPGAAWANGIETARLTASDGAGGDGLGGNGAVAISGDGQTIAAGSSHKVLTNFPGAVYVFVKPGANWVTGAQTAQLTMPASDNNARLGSGVAISGDGATLVAGARGRSLIANGAGAAFVFTRPIGGWVNATTATAAELAHSTPPGDFDELGFAVAISGNGNRVAAGMPGENLGPNGDQGAIILFDKPGGGWVSADPGSSVTAASGAADDGLGGSVAITTDGALIVGGWEPRTPPPLMRRSWSPTRRRSTPRPPPFRARLTSSSSTTAGSTVCTATATDSGPGATSPTGTVNFTRAGNSDGNGSTLVPGSCTLGSPTSDSASCSVVFNPEGGGNSVPRDDTIGGIYAGDGTHQGSADTELVDVESSLRYVNVTLSCTPGSAQVGAATRCTATVTDIRGGSPARAPLGRVGFSTLDGGSFSSQTCQLTPGPALASACSTLYIPAGPAPDDVEIKASYSGPTNTHAPSQTFPFGAMVSVTAAAPRSTSTTVSCPAAAAPGTTTTCTVTVADTGGGTASDPAGSVILSSNEFGTFANNGACTLGTPTGSSASCQLDYTPTLNQFPVARTDSISAAYAGNATHAGSVNQTDASVQVSSPPRDATSTTIGCAPGSLAPGAPSTCTVTVADTNGGSAPTGTANFWTPGLGAFSTQSRCTLGSPTGNSASCSVTYTPSSTGTSARADTIAATYGGDFGHTGSESSDGTVAVIGSAAGIRTSAMSVACAPANPAVNTATTCTATVNDNAPGTPSAPTGAVTLATNAAGAFSPSASCALAASGAGAASCAVTYTPSATGTQVISGTYPGDAAHIGASTSGPGSQNLTVLAATGDGGTTGGGGTTPGGGGTTPGGGSTPGVPRPPGRTIPPVPGVAKVVGRVFTTSAKRVVTITVTCVGKTACVGSLDLQTTSKFALVKRGKKALVKLGAKAFSIQAGRSQKLTIKLSAKTFSLLKVRKSLRTKATLKRKGAKSGTSIVVTVRAPKVVKKKR